jgi:hypothetical protein
LLRRSIRLLVLCLENRSSSSLNRLYLFEYTFVPTTISLNQLLLKGGNKIYL